MYTIKTQFYWKRSQLKNVDNKIGVFYLNGHGVSSLHTDPRDERLESREPPIKVITIHNIETRIWWREMEMTQGQKGDNS